MPANIKDLPVEVLSMIFQYGVSDFYVPYRINCQGLPSEMCRRRQRRLPMPGRNVFPFNVAAVCMLWFNILKSNPRYWRRIVIDVAQDPTPFLEVFKFEGEESNGGSECERQVVMEHHYNNSLDVIIFSSSKSPPGSETAVVDEAQRNSENSRARIIFEHIKPCLRRCRSITFDLVYQSSLPSAAHILVHRLPLLCELSLTCTAYDYDDLERNVEDLTFPLNTPFASLEKLSLTGLAFMELCHGDQLGNLVPKTFPLQLSINYFKFISTRSTSHNHDIVNRQSFREFKEGLKSYCGILDLSLSNLSMDCLPIIPNQSFRFFGLRKLAFDNVSRDFLSAFFEHSVFIDGDVDFLSFKRCSIPLINREDINLSWRLEGLTLELVDIPFSMPSSPPCSTPEDLRNESIYNALEVLSANELSLLRCDGVTDDLLHWLSGDESTPIKLATLHSLKIRECSGFTSGGIRSLIQDRKIRSDKSETFNDRDVCAVEYVQVKNGSEVSKDDAAYFLENSDVRWNMDEPEKHTYPDDDFFMA